MHYEFQFINLILDQCSKWKLGEQLKISTNYNYLNEIAKLSEAINN